MYDADVANAPHTAHRASSPTNPVTGIGETLKVWRTARGLSQRGVAARAGIAWSTVARWEAGKTQPTLTEWEAVLRALAIVPEEATRSLSLLQTPRALRRLRDSGGSNGLLYGGDLGRPPVGGDLLRAMRLRQGWRQADVARGLGVRQNAVARWEAGDAWPQVDKLHALCRLLNASPEEVAALTVGRFSLSSLLDLHDPEELHQEQWLLLHRGQETASAALTDLRFFALEARLHALLSSPTSSGSEGRKERLRLILSWTYSRHAQYLAESSRFGEVEPVADRAIDLRQRLGTKWDDEGWVPAVLARAISEARQRRGTAETVPDFRSLTRRLQRELPRVQNPDYRAWMLSQMANYAVLGRLPDLAVELSADALQIVENSEGPSIVAERRLRRRDYTALLAKAGRATEAVMFLPYLDGNAWSRDLPQNVRDLLVSVEVLLALQDRPAAARALQRSLALLDSVDGDHAVGSGGKIGNPTAGDPVSGRAILQELRAEAHVLAQQIS